MSHTLLGAGVSPLFQSETGRVGGNVRLLLSSPLANATTGDVSRKGLSGARVDKFAGATDVSVRTHPHYLVGARW